MTRQNLRKNAAFALLDRLFELPDPGIDVPKLTDQFIAIGYIDSDPRDYRRLQETQARELIREHRKLKQKRGETQLELANLFTEDEAGERHHYYKPCGRLDGREAALHVNNWDHRVERDNSLRQRHFNFQYERLGDAFVTEYEKLKSEEDTHDDQDDDDPDS